MVENTNLTMHEQQKSNHPSSWADNGSPPVVTTVTADQIANQLIA